MSQRARGHCAVWALVAGASAACNTPILFDTSKTATEGGAEESADARAEGGAHQEAGAGGAHTDDEGRGFDAGDSGLRACSLDTDCRLSSLHCDPVSHACVACLRDAHCGGGQPRCQAARHVCVECLAAMDCAANQACMFGRCIATCASGATCPAEAAMCDERGLCVRCAHDSECSVAAVPYCNVATGQCVACLDDAQCPTAQHCHPYRSVCVGCLSSTDCSSDRHICNPATGVCIDD